METIIKNNLAQAFPEAEVWTEQIEEGFSRPAFFVQKIQGRHSQEVGNRYLYTASYAVHYFTDADTQSQNEDLADKAVKLWAVLREISYQGETLHGYDLNHRTEDGVLQFFVTYRRYITVPMNDEKNKMMGMNYEVELETED